MKTIQLKPTSAEFRRGFRRGTALAQEILEESKSLDEARRVFEVYKLVAEELEKVLEPSGDLAP